jgi:hypothetical protein
MKIILLLIKMIYLLININYIECINKKENYFIIIYLLIYLKTDIIYYLLFFHISIN